MFCCVSDLLQGFRDGSVDKESACNAEYAGDAGLIHGSGGFPGSIPVFLPEKSHGQRSLVSYSL